MAALLFMMPESPVFLLSEGKEKRARLSLQWFRGIEYDITEELDQVTYPEGDRGIKLHLIS